MAALHSFRQSPVGLWIFGVPVLALAVAGCQSQRSMVGELPSPNFSADAATEAYLAEIPAAARARSDAYFEGGYWLILGIFSMAW